MTTALARPNQTQALTPQQPSQVGRIEQVLIRGDLSQLTAPERETYYMRTCETLGLNPLTRPFDYITLNGKLVLYANKGCAEQLRSIRKISISVTAREIVGDLCVVTANAKGPDGREDSSTGAVNVASLKGEALANAMMKAETKAKRRVTLSICGLNMLDETEVDSIPAGQKNPIHPGQPGPEDGDPTFVSDAIDFGQWKGRTIEWVLKNKGADKLAGYIAYLEDPAQVATRKPELIQPVADFIERASDAIAAYERELAEQMRSGQ